MPAWSRSRNYVAFCAKARHAALPYPSKASAHWVSTAWITARCRDLPESATPVEYQAARVLMGCFPPQQAQ